MIETLADLVRTSAERYPDNIATRYKGTSLSYAELDNAVDAVARGLIASGLPRLGRVGVLLGKQTETAIAFFAIARAGGVMVPLNSILKSLQIAYIMQHCNTGVLITTAARFRELGDILDDCPDLRTVIIVDKLPEAGEKRHFAVMHWTSLIDDTHNATLPRKISADVASIMYTSGSTGKPKGVVLSHSNLVLGAQSVASYLQNDQTDRILAVLPFSFDAGFSQLTTGISVGATVVLHDYLLPSDVVRIVKKEAITGITGVPPLWMQLTEQNWQDGAGNTVRYFANTGGKMPVETLKQLRGIFRKAKPYLMYGLTEAFRSTYLPPEYVDSKPESIGIAIPNAEILVIDDNGSICGPGESGELVHRGPLVSMGYWNDIEKTAERFKPLPNSLPELPLTELAVWSGDTVRLDDDGFLYFVGRRDDMIKTSGYRVSPTEIEEVVYDSGLAAEVAALGIPDSRLGQVIVLVAKPAKAAARPTEELMQAIKQACPNYMVPAAIHWMETLPRNANGKLDRKALTEQFAASRAANEV